MPDQRLRLPALVEHRRAQVPRLAAAFCDVPETVLGAPVEPVTPRTFSMLVASRNRFVCFRDGPPRFVDVVNYLWLHSPLHVPADHPEAKSRKREALRPLTRNLSFLGFRFSPERQAATIAIATTEIAEILSETFTASASGGSGDGPVLACLEAYFVNLCAVNYGWEPERTRREPLKRLFQLGRSLALSRGIEVQDDRECELIEGHLRRRNAELERQKLEKEPAAK